jgi:hypothetical protein
MPDTITDPAVTWRRVIVQTAGYSESLWRVADLHLPLAIVASTPEFEFLSRTLHSSGCLVIETPVDQ